MVAVRRPHRGDPVRDDQGRTGKIIAVMRADEEVIVAWPARVVVQEWQVFSWNGHDCQTFYYRVNGVLYCARDMPKEQLRPVTRTVDCVTFDELDGNWITSAIEDGGYWRIP